jgi:hypothetical protein
MYNEAQAQVLRRVPSLGLIVAQPTDEVKLPFWARGVHRLKVRCPPQQPVVDELGRGGAVELVLPLQTGQPLALS